MRVVSSGALAGWKRDMREDGLVLTLQVAQSVEEFRDRQFDIVLLSMNDRQLRSLTRDLTRASQERRIPLHADGWKARLMYVLFKRPFL